MSESLKPFLMGAETEFGVAGRLNGQELGKADVYDRLHAALRAQNRWMTGGFGDRAMFLRHGGRVYLDCGGHPEFCTPECATPRQVAQYDKANELLLLRARRHAEAAEPGLRLTVLKNNL